EVRIDIADLIASGGVDPREWVADWLREALALGLGVVAQRYVARRMGVGCGGARAARTLRASRAGRAGFAIHMSSDAQQRLGLILRLTAHRRTTFHAVEK
ncbi:hypothetical protein KEM52_000035, partial [Ascosphaera acerosa]